MTSGPVLPVVAGVDGSRTSVAAARLAAREARDRDAPVELLFAYPWTTRDRIPAPEGFDALTALRAAADLALATTADVLRREHRGVPVRTRLTEGPVVDVLLTAGEAAQLLCLGSRSTGSLGDLLLGSTAADVVRAAPCPVVVVPDRPTTTVSERTGVVVGVEGGPGEDEVLGFAVREAALRDTGLVAVHTWQHTVPGVGHVVAEPFVDERIAQRREEALLDDALERAGAGDRPVRRIVERGPAAPVLVAAGLGADLLVVGHRHRRGGAVGNLRSVTNAVLHAAACPVAVVPLHQRDVAGAGRAGATGASR
ncbi:universal stress protein [Geodermatophilus sp. SYSU D00697]